MPYELLGKNFVPPDIRAKVTGGAKFAEDFRVDGMVHAKLLLSPMPHARVRSVDVAAALDTVGVIGILTADDLPEIEAPNEPLLTNEPQFVGQPILAVAAETEALAADALDRIKVDLEPLPFVIDPIESLKPGGTRMREDGNTVHVSYSGGRLEQINWDEKAFARVGEGILPMGKKVNKEWAYGSLAAGFAAADYVLEESFVVGSNSHHSMEPRSALAYWENNRCFLYGSSQSQSWMIAGLANYIGISPDRLVYIAEYCGGGFGSKGNPYPVMAIPPHFSKKIGRPVMLRITRAQEYFLGNARAGFQGNVKIGFSKDGRIKALDLFLIKDGGSYRGFPDIDGAAAAVSVLYQPEAMRMRGVSVSTNTVPRLAQRGPGQNHMAVTIEPLLDKAATELGIDRVALRRLNAPGRNAPIGPKREPMTSCYVTEAMDKGLAVFNWDQRMQRHGVREGCKIRAVGIGQAFHPAGFSGFDGLVRITPDGKLHIHSGVGNLGTYSYAATSRVAAEVLKYDWANCVIERGDSRKGLPFNIGQFGSNTSFTMTRTNYVAAMDALKKLKEIAALEFGGDLDDYAIGDERVFLKGSPSRSIRYAEAANRAIQLGGKYSGVVPKDVNLMTKLAAQDLAGTGLIGISKDNLAIKGVVGTFTVGFAEIELDVETGKYEILDYLGVSDCGKVIHPQSFATQVKGGAVMGFGMAGLEHIVYDPQIGIPANVGYYQAKCPSYLDVPSVMSAAAVDLPDEQNPVGSKGMGEPVMGAAAAAVLCALSEALGGHYFKRTPVLPDMILNVLRGREQSHKPLQVHTQ